MDEWISIKEKLPPAGRRVLFVSRSLNKVLVGYHIKNGLMQFVPFINGVAAKSNEPMITDVICWMPMPAVPEFIKFPE